jgi:hypothetical protein
VSEDDRRYLDQCHGLLHELLWSGAITVDQCRAAERLLGYDGGPLLAVRELSMEELMSP